MSLYSRYLKHTLRITVIFMFSLLLSNEKLIRNNSTFLACYRRKKNLLNQTSQICERKQHTLVNYIFQSNLCESIHFNFFLI